VDDDREVACLDVEGECFQLQYLGSAHLRAAVMRRGPEVSWRPRRTSMSDALTEDAFCRCLVVV
jgi:hypothetical protein